MRWILTGTFLVACQPIPEQSPQPATIPGTYKPATRPTSDCLDEVARGYRTRGDSVQGPLPQSMELPFGLGLPHGTGTFEFFVNPAGKVDSVTGRDLHAIRVLRTAAGARLRRWVFWPAVERDCAVPARTEITMTT